MTPCSSRHLWIYDHDTATGYTLTGYGQDSELSTSAS